MLRGLNLWRPEGLRATVMSNCLPEDFVTSPAFRVLLEPSRLYLRSRLSVFHVQPPGLMLIFLTKSRFYLVVLTQLWDECHWHQCVKMRCAQNTTFKTPYNVAATAADGRDRTLLCAIQQPILDATWVYCF